MDEDKKILHKYSYNQLAIRNLSHRYIFDDWKHLDNLTNRLEEGAKILDIGCGSGVPIDTYLLEKGYNVTGIDISPEQITLAKTKNPNGEFVEMDMENLTFPVESFDAVISFYTIPHLPKTLHSNLLQSLSRLLKKGGYLMVTMGTNEFEETSEIYEDIKIFWSHFGKMKNLDIVRMAGFDILYEEIHYAGNDEHLIILARKNKDVAKNIHNT